MKTSIINNFKAVILGLVMVAGVGYAAAGTFSGPTCAPPNCNADAPLNVGPSRQSKLGSISINTATASPDRFGLDVFGMSRFFDNVQIGTTSKIATVQIVDGNQGEGKVLTSDINGVARWQALPQSISSKTYIVYKFNTKYSDLMANEKFRAWVGRETDKATEFRTYWSDNRGWYIRNREDKFLNTAQKLCTYMMNDAKALTNSGQYSGGDYGSDRNNGAYYWDIGSSTWKIEGHSDNGAIDITSLSCAGSGITQEGLFFVS